LTRARRIWTRLPALVALITACGGSAPTYTPRDPALRELPLYFYVPSETRAHPRAFVFFLGNDVGFWQPHRDLASKLSDQDYAITGFDVRPLLASLPESAPGRDSAFAERITSIIVASRREVGADSLPLIIAGHSLGAELAIWTAAHARLPRLAGVLALSPGSRSHHRVTLSDITNTGEPDDAESISVADAVRALPSGVPVAIVRGDGDKYRFADSSLVAAGGTRAQLFPVHFASHSLKRIVVALPVVSRAIAWLLSASPPSTG
jgi:pimeloyl-ACP methyl ester carboxylesterase